MYHHFRDKREISTEVYRTSQNAIVAKVIDAVLIDRPRAVVIDLSAVEILGSAGLRLLVTANEQLQRSIKTKS